MCPVSAAEEAQRELETQEAAVEGTAGPKAEITWSRPEHRHR